MRSKRARRLLQGAAVAIILLFWAQALARNWQQLASFTWQIDLPWLAASMALLVVQMVLLATIWWRALVLMGEAVGWRLSVSIWLKTQIARYVPGGIWDIAGRLALGHENGISLRAMSASIVLEIVLQVLSASLFMLVALLIRSGADAQAYLPLVALVTAASLVVLIPSVFRRLINGGLKLFHRPPLDIQISFADMVVLFLARMLGHLMLGVGFVLFARGLTPITWEQAPLMITAYVGAWLIGFLAVVVPMGVGVREGVLALLLQAHFPFGVIGAMALGYRTWLLLRDLVAALIGVWLGRGVVRRL